MIGTTTIPAGVRLEAANFWPATELKHLPCLDCLWVQGCSAPARPRADHVRAAARVRRELSLSLSLSSSLSLYLCLSLTPIGHVL